MSIPKKLTKDQIINEHSTNLSSSLQTIKTGNYNVNDINYPYHLYLKDSDIKIRPEGSEICKFLSGKSIFVTGGTGFLGKALVEKLLRSCIDIDTLYLLVRAKKGQSQKERMDDLFDSIFFDPLSQIHPNFKSKIVIINGDMRQPCLGISDENVRILMDKVNIIYHVAATTRFDEKIRVAVDINLKGTLETIQLAKGCKNLVSMVYVGTAFSNCNKKQITEERIYEPVIQPQILINLVEKLNDEQLTEVTPSLLNGFPNTYALTKQITEKAIEYEAKTIPISIFRPTIVMCAHNEPLRGWGDNLFGAIGFMAGIIVGIIRCAMADLKLVADFVPLDYTVNACIACSYETSKKKNGKISVYNLSSGTDNPATWGFIFNFTRKNIHVVGCENILWYPTLTTTSRQWLFPILNLVLHKIPAFMFDSVLFMLGKKERIGPVYKKIDKFIDALTFFTLNEFKFKNGNTTSMWNSLNDQDKKNFFFDIKSLNWKEYLIISGVAGKQYVTHGSMNNIEGGRKKVAKFYYFHTLLKTILILMLVYLLYRIINWIL